MDTILSLQFGVLPALSYGKFELMLELEYSIGNGQFSDDVTCSAHEMGRYLANAIVSDKSK